MEKLGREFTNFAGGLTDQVFDQRPSRCLSNDNWLVDDDSRLTWRPGSYVFSPNEPIVGSSADRVARIFSRRDESLSGPKLFAFSKDTFRWASLPNGDFNDPVNGNQGYLNFSLSSYDTISVGEWARVMYLAKNAYDEEGGGHALAYKMYMGEDQDTEVFVPAGMPAVQEIDGFVEATLLTEAVTLANILRGFMSNHFLEATAHFAADNGSNGILAAAATNLATLITLVNSMIDAYVRHSQDEGNSRVYHSPDNFSSDCPQSLRSWQTLPTTKYVTTLVEACQRLDELKETYNSHTISRVRHRGASLAIYRDSTGYLGTIVQGPTPLKSMTSIALMLVSFKTKFNAHLADATAGTDAHDVADVANPLTVDPLVDADGSFGEARYRYDLHEFDSVAAGASAYHPADTAQNHKLAVSRQNDPDFLAATPTGDTLKADPVYGFVLGDVKIPEFVEIFNDLVAKYNAHVDDLDAHYATGTVTRTASSENKSVLNPLESANYIYGFAWCRRYTKDGNLEAEDVGPILVRSAFRRFAIENVPMFIEGIPDSLPSGWEDLDDGDSEIVMKVFRTTNNGQTLYLVDELPLGESKYPGLTDAESAANDALLPAGTVAYRDVMKDDDLVNQETAYTNGGVRDREYPPAAKIVHVVGGYGYWANVNESVGSDGAVDTSPQTSRIYQSIPGIPDAVPRDFFTEIQDEVVGVSSHRDTVVSFGTDSLYRIEGKLDEKGGGSMIPVPISSEVGCVAEGSIVQTDRGIFFFGNDGIYLTDGHSLIRVSPSFSKMYQDMVRDPVFARLITGTYDKGENRVLFGVCRSSVDKNDAILALDLNQPLGADACWTSMSNKSGPSAGYYDHLAPSALHYHRKQKILFRGHGRAGVVMQHDPDHCTDPYVNESISSTLWGTKAVRFDFQSCAQSFGTEEKMKYLTQVDVRFKPQSDLSLAVNTNGDDHKVIAALVPISYTAEEREDSTVASFGTDNVVPFYKGLLAAKRHAKAPGLRSYFRQFQFTSSLNLIQDSEEDDKPVVTINALTKRATMASDTFPADLEGCELTLAADGYEYAFEIKRRVGDRELELWDEEGNLVNVTTHWRIKGYSKTDKPNLLSYSVKYGIVDTPASSPGDDGAIPEATVEVRHNRTNYRVVTAAATWSASDDLLLGDTTDGVIVLTLPDATLTRNDRRVVGARKITDDANVVRVVGYNGQTVDEAVNNEIEYKGTTTFYMAVNGNWILV